MVKDYDSFEDIRRIFNSFFPEGNLIKYYYDFL